MIGGKRQRDHRSDGGPAVDGDHAIDHASHGQNARLRRHNDGSEGVHVVHAQIADRECAAGNVRRLKASGLGAFGQFAASHGNLFDPAGVGFVQYRRDYSFFDRYSQCDVDVGVMTNAVAGPARVHSRMLG